MNRNVLNKIEKLLIESEDIFNDYFDAVHSDNPSEEASKKAMQYTINNRISPFDINKVSSNLAAGVGKSMDSNEAMGLVDQAEKGTNTIPQSHALHHFFTNPDESNDSFEVQSFKRGLGKEVDLDEYNRYVQSEGDSTIPEENDFRIKALHGVIPQQMKEEINPNSLSSLSYLEMYGMAPQSSKSHGPMYDIMDNISRQYMENNFGSNPQEVLSSYREQYGYNESDIGEKRESMVALEKQFDINGDPSPMESQQYAELNKWFETMDDLEHLEGKYAPENMDRIKTKQDFLNIITNIPGNPSLDQGLEHIKINDPDLYDRIQHHDIRSPYIGG